MAKNWALVIGINQYTYLQSLNFAKRDAELMKIFLSKKLDLNKSFIFRTILRIFCLHEEQLLRLPHFGTTCSIFSINDLSSHSWV